jgi:DNA-binding MarR family transcriptional regulator
MVRATPPRGQRAEAGQRAGEDGVLASSLSDRDFAQLANFRATLRQLVRQTELEAQQIGLTPQHYHLLLAIKGFPEREWANISELAERLQIRHNAVIGLINRAMARGLVVRRPGDQGADRRVVRVSLTPEGERILHILVAALRGERQRVSAAIEAMTHTTDDPPVTPTRPA